MSSTHAKGAPMHRAVFQGIEEMTHYEVTANG